jgi:hypothetical protein
MPPSATAASGSSKSARSARDKSSARKNKGSTGKWGRTGDSKSGSHNIAFTGSRNLVFMVGGLAFSELKIAREVMEKESREIMIGSTAFMNPKDFMSALESLS